MLSRIPLLALALCVAGCGFQLQGAFDAPESMSRTYLAADDHFSLFYRELQRQLSANGIQLVDTPEKATATLSIHVDDTDQRVLSVSARNVPTEYEVYYSIEYSVDAGETSLLSRQFITVTRDYTYDETQVLGKAREESVLRDALVSDLVRIVLKQLEAL